MNWLPPLPSPSRVCDDPVNKMQQERLQAGAIGYAIGIVVLIAVVIWKWPF